MYKQHIFGMIQLVNIIDISAVNLKDGPTKRPREYLN